MAFVSGITRSNYDTVGAQQLSNAESQLNSAIRSDADSSILLQLQKRVDDIKNTIDVREKDREKYLDKLSATERRVQEAQFQQIKDKFDETNERAEARTEKTFDSIRSVSKTIGNAFDSLADNVFHTLLGPLQLIVNPLEEALHFNLFGLAKKPVGDFLESRFPATYESLKKNGGLIGAVGVTIVDAINKSQRNAGLDLEGDGSLDISSILGSGLSLASILKGAGVIGLVGLAIGGIITAWKNDWDKNGIGSAQDLKALLADEEASTGEKIWGVVKFGMQTVFGSAVAGIKGAIGNISDDVNAVVDKWNDEDASTGEKIWDISVIGLTAIPNAVLGGAAGAIKRLGDAIFGFFDEDSAQRMWWDNFKEHLDGFVSDLIGGIRNILSWDNVKQLFDNPLGFLTGLPSQIEDFTFGVLSHVLSMITGQDINLEPRLLKAVDIFWNGFLDIIDPLGLVHTHKDFAETTAHDESNAAVAAAYQVKTEEETKTDYDAGAYFTSLFPDDPRHGVQLWRDWQLHGDGMSPQQWYAGLDEGHVIDLNDAIISKDNDLYRPSPEDNIILTKDDVSMQSQLTSIDSAFKSELMSVLKEIASNLRQPTVVNNVSSGSSLSFEGFRL